MLIKIDMYVVHLLSLVFNEALKCCNNLNSFQYIWRGAFYWMYSLVCRYMSMGLQLGGGGGGGLTL